MSELTVVIKGEDKTYRQKFLCYNNYQASCDDDFIKQCIHEASKSFGGEIESVRIKISIEMA